MEYIDNKFKDSGPTETVEKISNCLKKIGISLNENWCDSGIDNCCSLSLASTDGFPRTAGKGITKDFARASAYGEYIERLQSGLFFYKFQSLECDPELDLQSFSPDAKYFTKKELAENGEWMDYLIETYGGTLTREVLAEQCEMYAHSEDGKILTVPFYSIFEDKYVYMPTGFIEHMYSANGCCVGNTKEEALVHALAEIMERKGAIKTLMSGTSVPEIPETVLSKFPTVSKILKEIRQNKRYDVKILDLSIGNGFPVVAVRVIDKENHSYIVNAAADPVLEIAIQRTLTETFQNRNIENLTDGYSGKILNKITDISITSNVLNQLETAAGLYTADFFAEEITCNRECTEFEDNSNLNNVQLLQKIYKLYSDIGKPVYIRNYAFLGFPCYKVIVPGFSESRGFKLNEPIQEYAIGHIASKVLRDPLNASDTELNMLILLRKMIANSISRINSFSRLSGIPVDKDVNQFLLYVTLAYTNYRLKATKETLKYLDKICALKNISNEDKQYFACVKQYLEFSRENIDEEKIYCILRKFYSINAVEKLRKAYESGTPFDEYLMQCDTKNCENCKMFNKCNFNSAKTIIRNAGKKYAEFIDGQNKKHFVLPE